MQRRFSTDSDVGLGAYGLKSILLTDADHTVEQLGSLRAIREELARLKVLLREAGEVAAPESAADTFLHPATLYDPLQEERLRIATHVRIRFRLTSSRRLPRVDTTRTR